MESEQDIIQYCKGKAFAKEIMVLQKGENMKRSSSVFRLNTVLSEGIFRVGGRLSRVTMHEESKQPAI